jgi:hypothetical protein
VIYATALPDLSSASIEIVDSLSLNVFWEGLYYSVSLLYGTDPSFITVDGSLNDVYDTSASLIDLTPDTVYYFKIIPYTFIQGDMGTVIADLSSTTYFYPFVTSINHQPNTSSISLTWDGSFRRVYSVERHQFIHGYGRERSLYNGKQLHHNESTKQHNILYGITPFSIPIRVGSAAPYRDIRRVRHCG